MTSEAIFQRLLQQDRWIVAASLLGVTLLAWNYLWHMATAMAGIEALPVWDSSYALMVFTMWAVMMIGMMLPSAAPAILLYAGLVRRSTGGGNPALRTYLFAGGYLLVWTLFSLAATGLQWLLDQSLLLSAQMASRSTLLGGGLLILAGLYQWTPLKDVCLRSCRGPADFLIKHWPRSAIGASWTGMQHGLYCMGCCWAIMVLLFVGGVMNLFWIAAIMIFVLVEKIAPLGVQTGRLASVVLLLCGCWLIFRSLTT